MTPAIIILGAAILSLASFCFGMSFARADADKPGVFIFPAGFVFIVASILTALCAALRIVHLALG